MNKDLPEAKDVRPEGQRNEISWSEPDWLGKIAPDPFNPPNALIFAGFLGKSSESNHARLYLGPDLSDYLEIPHEDILHFRPALGTALYAWYVWVKADAELVHVSTRDSQSRDKFLQGSIEQEYQKGLDTAPLSEVYPNSLACPTVLHCFNLPTAPPVRISMLGCAGEPPPPPSWERSC